MGAARWLTSPGVAEYRVGLDGFSLGAISVRSNLQYLSQGGASKAAWGGAGADVIIRTTPRALPYIITGAAVGIGRTELGNTSAGLGAWGGVGAELLAIGPVGLQAEALYTWRGAMRVQSVSLGLRLGSRIGRQVVSSSPSSASSPSSPSQPALPRANPQDEAILSTALTPREPRVNAAAGIVATALSAMGTPYRWGGSSSAGFDCSGLIQFAYGEHGVSVPRTSAQQAEAGYEVGKDLAALEPGDILTFAERRDGRVTHVGLYVGDGKFIHSASGGVQLSTLSDQDATGLWWHARWVGARRVMER